MPISRIIRPALLVAGMLTATVAAANASPLATAIAPVAETSAIQKVGYCYHPRRDCDRPLYRHHHAGHSRGYYRAYRYYALGYDGFRPYYRSYVFRPRHYIRDYDY